MKKIKKLRQVTPQIFSDFAVPVFEYTFLEFKGGGLICFPLKMFGGLHPFIVLVCHSQTCYFYTSNILLIQSP